MNSAKLAKQLVKEVTIFLLTDPMASGSKSTIITDLAADDFYSDYVKSGYKNKLDILKRSSAFNIPLIREALTARLKAAGLYEYQDTIRVTYDIKIDHSDPGWGNSVQFTSDEATYQLRTKFNDVKLIEATRLDSK